MKRLRVILLFLLLGAIVNVAVAWGCAAWVIPKKDVQSTWLETPVLGKHNGWIFRRYDNYGATQLIGILMRHNELNIKNYEEKGKVNLYSMLPAWSDMRIQMDELVEEKLHKASVPADEKIEWHILPSILMQHAFGFPFRSLYWKWENGRRVENAVPKRGTFANCINIKARPFPPSTPVLNEQRALPLGVIPFGFAINTILYASLLWLLIHGPFVFRRFIRHKRGLCLKCAYDLRGAEHEACPECGTEVRKTV